MKEKTRQKDNLATKLAVLASVAALATGGVLAGCANSSTTPQNASSASAATSTSGEDGTPAALGAPQDPLDSKTVWLPAMETHYEYDGNGNVSSKDVYSYDYDEHGNAKTLNIIRAQGTSLERESTTSFSEYDTSGYPHSKTDEEGKVTEYDVQLDERGRAVSLTDNNGSLNPDHVGYTYWDSGAVMVERASTDASGTMEYDEYGYLVQTASSGAAVSYTWTFSKNGTPVKCLEQKTLAMKDAIPAADVEYSLECDEHGNIVRVLQDGKAVCEMTYVEIKEPSISAKLAAYKKDIL